MKLSLNTWQRVTLYQVIGLLQGDVNTIRKAIAIMDILELRDEEKKLVGYEQNGDRVTWSDAEHCFEVEIEDSVVGVLLAAVRNYSMWPVVRGKEVLNIIDQLAPESP